MIIKQALKKTSSPKGRRMKRITNDNEMSSYIFFEFQYLPYSYLVGLFHSV